jgi:hypothetical protein
MPLKDSVDNSGWDCVYWSVAHPVWDSILNSVCIFVRNPAHNSVWNPVYRAVANSVYSSVDESIDNLIASYDA